ncbi:MAG TPA: hypothetical protein VMV53_04170 [Acidimicrobiales bacterium]|nr:hypothetical protein [Acidimicrobiales bacterium]
MPEARHDQAVADDDRVLAREGVSRDASEGRVALLRGPEALSARRKYWLGAGALGLIIFAAAIVVAFVSATNDNARIERMRANGIPVTVTVAGCVGSLGGSGSNIVGYTCQGDYRVGGTAYHEIIGSMTTLAAPGTLVRAVADPTQHSSVVLASAARTATASPKVYALSGVLSVMLALLTLGYGRLARRSTSSRRSTPPSTRN